MPISYLYTFEDTYLSHTCQLCFSFGAWISPWLVGGCGDAVCVQHVSSVGTAPKPRQDRMSPWKHRQQNNVGPPSQASNTPWVKKGTINHVYVIWWGMLACFVHLYSYIFISKPSRGFAAVHGMCSSLPCNQSLHILPKFGSSGVCWSGLLSYPCVPLLIGRH